MRLWTLNVLDVVDRIRNTSVLGDALITEVYLAILVNGYVLKKSVAGDSTIDIGLRLLVKVDYFRIATALIVEYSLVIPAVFVVTNELTFRIG